MIKQERFCSLFAHGKCYVTCSLQYRNVEYEEKKVRLPVNRTGHVHVTSMHMMQRATIVTSSSAPKMRVKGEVTLLIVCQYAQGEPVIQFTKVQIFVQGGNRLRWLCNLQHRKVHNVLMYGPGFSYDRCTVGSGDSSWHPNTGLSERTVLTR